MFRSFLRRLLPLSLLLCLLAGPLAAQEPGAPPAGEGSPDAAAAASVGDGGSYAALLRLLEDEQLRGRLIEDLRRLQAGAAGDLPADPVAAAPQIEEQQETVSLARKIARTTRGSAEWLASGVAGLSEELAELEFGGPAAAVEVETIAEAALALGALIAITIATFLLLRAGARRIYADLGRRAMATRNLPLRALAVAVGSVVDALVVVLAWVAGYAAALFLLSEAGAMDTRQSLFLNAFLLIEMTKVVLRLLLSPRFPSLRPLPIRDEDAAYWYTWLAGLAGLLGYGLLLVVPIVAFDLSAALGRALSLLIGLAALFKAVLLVLQNRAAIRQALERQAARSDVAFNRSILQGLAHAWHLIAIIYLVVLFIIAAVRPEEALPFMLAATLRSVVAVIVGVLVTYGLSRAIAFGVHLPEETRRSLPMLEQRLNAYVPNLLRVIRLVVFVSVLLYLTHAWGLFDLAVWISEGSGGTVLSVVITLGLVLLGAMLVWIAVASWIEHRLNPAVGGADRQPGARERTLLSIFRNAFAVVLVIMTAMIMLSEIGIDIGPLLAGAGVLGLAIGFGAQRMVQDVITGVFIQMENALNVGDVVTVAGLTGTVEKLSIRSVGIRDLHGTYHLVSFSEVGHVSNFMRDFGYHVGEYGIAYRENVDDAIARLQEAFEELREDPAIAANLLGDLEVFGVTALGDSAVTLRVRIKTLPGAHWGIGRAYNKLVKKHFDAAGIEIPFPHMTLYFGESKEGEAPPLRVLQQRAARDLLEAGGASAPPMAPEAPPEPSEPVKEVAPGDEFDTSAIEEADIDPEAPGAPQRKA